MKHVISLAVLLAISTVALANSNNPAQRCKRYAEANAFQSTIAQLCGGNSQSEYAGVMQGQACEETVGKEKLAGQGKTQSNELQAEYNRIGHQQFCAKYSGRQ